MVAVRPIRPNFLSVTSVVFLFINWSTFHSGWTLPQIPNEQYQPNIYIPQAPTDFSHPSEAGRDFSPSAAAAVNQAPVQEDFNGRPDYDTQPNEDDINDRPRGRPYAGSFAEELDGATGDDSEKSIPGSPEQDYPIFEEIPRTSFTCHDKPVPAYYADVEARCQVFHICDVGGHKHSFLCPNGSVFNQKYLVCDWWYDFACENAENLFSKQLIPTETTTQFTLDVNNAAQTFSHDGSLIYQPVNNGNFNLNPGVFNPGLPQTQLDTQQQVYTNNFNYVPQNDIFHGAETGVPGRDLIHSNFNSNNNDGGDNTTGNHNNNENHNYTSNGNPNNDSYKNENTHSNGNNYHNNENFNNGNLDNGYLNNGNLNNGNPNNGNFNNENFNNVNQNNGNYNNGNQNNGNSKNGNLNIGDFNNGNYNNGNYNNGKYNNEHFNNSNNFNNHNINRPSDELHNIEDRNINKGGHEKSYVEKQTTKLNHEFGDNKNLNSFQNSRDESNGHRKQGHKGVRRVVHGHPRSTTTTTTQSSLNLNTREKIADVPLFNQEQRVINSPTKVNPTEQGAGNGTQRNENDYSNNNDEQLYRKDSDKGFNFQTNVNSYNTPTTQFQPQNTYREANNFQTNQYARPDAIQP